MAQPNPTPDTETTAVLLDLVRSGNRPARERLVARFLPILTRWSRGRLPPWARDLNETDDLVQVTLLRALDRVKDFEPRHEGAFLAYLRRILQNQITDQIRRAARSPRFEALTVEHPQKRPSPLEEAVGQETLQAYEAALAELPEQQHQAVVLRVEMGFTHQQVAEAVGSPTANAARMLVARALVRLAEVMNERR